MSYLLNLAERLTTGLSHWEAPRREGHANFLRSQQMPDGGFRGREGDSDLYYTGFALRGLVVLGELTTEDAARVLPFLRRFDPRRLSTIDLLSWLYAALVVQSSEGTDLLADLPNTFPRETSDRLEELRRDDGGYAKSEQGALGSTYHTFLVTLIQELLGQDTPVPNRLIQFLFDQQRDDGGFVEIAPMKRGGTNPTAAAAAVLNRFGMLDDELREDIAVYMRMVRAGGGGFAANTRIPFPDGLSTFTAILTAQDLGLRNVVADELVAAFATGELEFPCGGFRGASWDDQADVEYTFYGLGVLSLVGGR